jgi:hypothetical protein
MKNNATEALTTSPLLHFCERLKYLGIPTTRNEWRLKSKTSGQTEGDCGPLP